MLDITPLPKPFLETTLGRLYAGDCLKIMAAMPSESIDLFFADPPFNLNKDYGPGVSDLMKEADYLAWCLASIRPWGQLFWAIPDGAGIANSVDHPALVMAVLNPSFIGPTPLRCLTFLLRPFRLSTTIGGSAKSAAPTGQRIFSMATLISVNRARDGVPDSERTLRTFTARPEDGPGRWAPSE